MSKFIISVILLVLVFYKPVLAAPYEAYLYDRVRIGDTVSSINGYVPERSFSGQSLGVGAFLNPSDLFTTQDGTLYVADTGNHRIVVIDLNSYIVLGEIDGFYNFYKNGEFDTFERPQGVFVAQNGDIYIADTNNGRVVHLNSSAELIKIVGEPVSELISEHFIYRPRKVSADLGGRLFVVAEATTEGLIQFSSRGEFIGFFGGNRVTPNFAELFLRLFLTREQRARRSILVPVEYSNVYVDSRNFIYVTTIRQTQNQVKRLNFNGSNILRADGPTGNRFGDLIDWTGDGHSIVDVTADEFENFTILDSLRGRFYQYNQMGELLFVAGGIGDSLGLFRNPIAIDQWNEKIFVLDNTTNDVTVFIKNEFGEAVHSANNAFFSGDYETAALGWQRVIELNTNFGPAYVGLGHEAMRLREFENAAYYYEGANYRRGYSRAFREIRNAWLREYFTVYSLGLIAFAIVALITKPKRRALAKRVKTYFEL